MEPGDGRDGVLRADFGAHVFWRAILGVGEASYGVIAPPCSPTCSTPKRWAGDGDLLTWRCRWAGRSGMRSADGSADYWGWQDAFLVVGLPGSGRRSRAW